MFAVAALAPVLGAAPLILVTLTYPDIPEDGAQAKRDLHKLRKRMMRRFGPLGVVWKMEFQARGSVHFHLLVVAPDHWRHDDTKLLFFRRWIAHQWFEVVGSGNAAHLTAGTRTEWSRARKPAAYFCGYSRKKSKEYQHVVPTRYESLGRWWGVWNMRAEWTEVDLETADYIVVRRTMLRARAAKCRRRLRRPCGLAGVSWITEAPAADTLLRLLRNLEPRGPTHQAFG